jgi:hypothetical protein
MKKFLFTLLMALPFLSYGQFTKGDKFIGGYFRLSSQTPTNSNSGPTTDNFGFSINPFMGFLVSEKFAVGGRIGYSYYNSIFDANQPTQSKFNSSGFSIGLLSRRYFSISDKFVFSINGQLDFDRGTETRAYSSGSFDSKTQNYQIGVTLQPCFIFFPSPKWGIETSIGSISYNYSRNLSTDLGQSYFNLVYGQISLGLSYYFRKAK